MSDVVIRAEGLGKKYLIGHQATDERYTTLRDVVVRGAKGLARSARDMLRGRQLVAGDEVEDFWTLKDVSFEIKRGDVVGIIGRNGAGKSTLLKILSRITEPSTGRVEIKGRVASLLEVGTGFHPELSGRENIYLNGAILGMTRAEIKRKFDEIVAFADVEKFLDTPVKRYSSGMYVRLAFAVAAHLEPEILVVDEVLAVGDAEFQKKCLGKMGEVAGQGRTVLFVSHQLASVGMLCTRAYLLEGGGIASTGNPRKIIQEYIGARTSFDRLVAADRAKPLFLTECHTGVAERDDRSVFNSGERIRFRFDLEVCQPVEPFRVGLRIDSPDLGTILTTADADYLPMAQRELGRYRFSCDIPPNLLSPGDYTVSIAADVPMRQILFNEQDLLQLTVTPLGAAGAEFPDVRRGAVRPILAWQRRGMGAAEAAEATAIV
jgi:lipopolysaccharide transport system ATP-binding protein